MNDKNLKPKETAFTDAFLNEVEQDHVAKIAGNPVLLNALKKIILADVYYKGTLRKGVKPDPTVNAALSFAFSDQKKTDEELGRDLRALGEGVRLVEGGFARIEKYKKAPTPEEKSGENPAR